MKSATFSSCLVVLGLLLGIYPASAEDVSHDAPARWHVMQIEGQRVGFMCEQETRDEAGRVVSEIDVEMTIRRGTVPITITAASRFIETPEGEPIEARATMHMGGTPIVTTLRFKDEQVEMTAEQGGNRSTQTLPRSQQAWLPPSALSRHVSQQLEQGAQRIEVWTLDPLISPTPFKTVMQVAGRENIEVLGKTVPAVVWDASVSILPGVPMREYVDEHGKTLRSTISLMPGLSITILQADEQLAKSPVELVEVMTQTLVRPKGQRIDNARKVRRMHVMVKGAADAPPTTAVQTVTPKAMESAWDVAIDLNNPRASESLDEQARKRYLASSVVINHEDPAVLALRDRALATKMKREPYEDAELLRGFVYRFVDAKDLSVGFATAGDVARTAQGDCTEHGVLLAALLRAQGIPSRCVSGLVYADAFLGRRAIFGYHFWTQAYFDPDGTQGPQPLRWVDLDATLDEANAFDATHIALRIAAMDQPSPINDLIDLAPLLGRLSIEVVEQK
jgi:hypothetical protein